MTVERARVAAEAGGAVVTAGIEYLDVYENALVHQREHGSLMTLSWEREQPSEACSNCLRDGRKVDRYRDIKRRYSWAVPNEDALKTIADHSPRGVVEIGAGGGYWSMLLRERGVDVVAYDPDPLGQGEWHSGHRWSEVLAGDHTAVTGHADRTLFLCWPSYSEAWTGEAVDLFDGDTVVYIGEGSGGCTGDDRMHALLGEQVYCYHDDEPCTCDRPEPKFELADTVEIPQWWGIHDRLRVYKRTAGQ